MNINSSNKVDWWKALRRIGGSSAKLVTSNSSPEIFNNYFANIGTKLADHLDNAPYSSNLSRIVHFFESQFIIIGFIYDQLLLPKDKSNNDIITIDSKVMQVTSSVIAPSLTMIFDLPVSYYQVIGNVPRLHLFTNKRHN